MSIGELCNSIYLGDRFCEKMTIQNDRISFQIDCISRVRSKNGNWEYYNDEDIYHGLIVFDLVSEYYFCNGSKIDEDIELEYVGFDNDLYHFYVTGCENVENTVITKTVTIEIFCKDFYLMDKDVVIRK